MSGLWKEAVLRPTALAARWYGIGVPPPVTTLTEEEQMMKETGNPRLPNKSRSGVPWGTVGVS